MKGKPLVPVTLDRAILDAPIPYETKCLLLGLARLQAADVRRPAPVILAPGPKGPQ